MKKAAILVLLSILFVSFSACGDQTSDKREEKDEKTTEASQSANSAGDALIAYKKAYLDKDAEKVYSYIPQIYLDYLEKDKSEVIDEISEKLSQNLRDSSKCKIKIDEPQKVDKNIVEQWNTYLDQYSDYADYYDDTKHKVTEAEIISVGITEFTGLGVGKSEETNIVVVMENGEWKILSNDIWDLYNYSFDWENGNDFEHMYPEFSTDFFGILTE